MPSIRPMSHTMLCRYAEGKKPSQNGDAEHDEAGRVVSKVELVHAERPEEDSEQTGCHMVFRSNDRLLINGLPVRVIRSLGGRAVAARIRSAAALVRLLPCRMPVIRLLLLRCLLCGGVVRRRRNGRPRDKRLRLLGGIAGNGIHGRLIRRLFRSTVCILRRNTACRICLPGSRNGLYRRAVDRPFF